MLADVIVYFHLLFVALGLGLAVRLDFLFFRGRHARPGGVLLADAIQSHHMISSALVGLWLSGLCLVYLRTGLVFDAFSPKLWMKLIVVTALSFNAIIIGVFVMPVMEQFRDRPVLAIPLRFKLPMAVSAATSVFCWFSALALGAMTTLKTMSWAALSLTFAIEYGLGLAIAISLALWVRAGPVEAQVPRGAVQSHDTST